MSKRNILLLILVMSCFNPAKAQHPYYYSLNEENGLPSNETYCLRQDSMGYIWMGCNAGLFRYNGESYRGYFNPLMNSKAISGLRLDKDGRIWCYNFTGQIFYVRNDSLLLFKDYSKVCKTYPRFTFDRQGNIWVTADQLIEVLTREGRLLQSFSNVKNRKNLPVYWSEIELTPSGDIFIHTSNGGLWQTNSLKNPPENVSDTLQEKLLNNRGTFKFLNKKLYLINEINPERKYLIWEIKNRNISLAGQVVLKQTNDILYSICSNHKNELMLLTSDGVLRADTSFVICDPTPIFPKEKVSDMLVDREGSYWFSSLQNGVMVIPSIDLEIYHSKNSLIADENISTLLALNSTELLLGTYKGDLYRFNLVNGSSKPYMAIGSSIFRHVRKIKTYGGKLFVARGAFSEIKNNRERLRRIWNARDFDFMNDSIYFVLSDQVLGIHYNDTAEVSHVTTIRPKGGSAIFCDSIRNTVYFACNDGMFKYTLGSITEITNKGAAVYASSLQCRGNELWIGSISDGILIYSLHQHKIIRYINQQSGLCSNTIRNMKNSDKGMWVITDKCLALIGTNGAVSTYGLPEGLLAKQINAIDIIGNTAWIATNKGLVRMPVSIQSHNTVLPGISITAFLVNDHGFSFLQPAYLHWKQNNIRISFEGISLRSRGSFLYKYRLTGNDTAWTYATAGNNTVRYNGLDPGSYTFEVICVNEDGVEGKPVTLLFTIQTPYWQRWWFYLMVAAAFAGSIYLIFTVRVKILKKRAADQNQLTLSQLTALKAQMNPHFMYNTLNSIQDLIVQRDLKSTNYYLSQFGSLMRKVLDASGNEQILLGEEIEILHLYLALEKLRFGEKFHYRIILQDTLDREQVYIPSMIIQPFVENAIKHGLLHKPGDKNLTIRFSQQEDQLICTITDNGIGREKAAEIKARAIHVHRSFATEATEKRLALINNTRDKKIKLIIHDLKENQVATGTEVVITIPLHPRS